jgi:hypothetical protein
MSDQPQYEILDPTYEAFTKAEHQASRPSAPRIKPRPGMRIGLLANGKANSEALLERVYRQLEKRLGMPLGEPVRVLKPSISVPPTEGDMARLIGEADVVVTAIGD